MPKNFDACVRRYLALLESLGQKSQGVRSTLRLLSGWLRERGVTGLTVKKRGIRLDEDQLRKQLKIGRGAGDGDSATVVLTRVGGEQAVLVVEAS